MSQARCPGQDGRNLRIDLLRCPGCGAEVEIFSDEQHVKCYSCGHRVTRAQVASCVSWCANARQCLGEARWKALKDASDSPSRDKTETEEEC